ncbi:MAG: acetyl-CoA acetyltransferase, partial [Planctomycetota bacterium]
MTDSRTPVLVGVGVAAQRCDDPSEALEPSALMVRALEAAADDAGSRALLREASSIRVPRGFWAYADPGRLVADAVGAGAARSVLAELGVLQQTLLNDACRAIASGDEEVALITGGEAKYRSLRAQRCGVTVPETTQEDATPDQVLEPAEPFWSEVEASRGLMMPVQFFTVIESALRYADRLDLDTHRDRVAALWARFSEVAADNPHAWRRERVAAADIRDPSEENPMLAFPYTKQHNSDWNVDQAAGLILCSAAKAREWGVPEARWIHPHSGTESNHVLPLSARPELHRSHGAAIAGGRALELAGRCIDDVSHIELYSCFPAAVQVFARELGLSLERRLTVTGGMRFAGGPLNNYVLQATVRMAQVLRADPGSAGLVTSLSGFINKVGFAVWASAPAPQGFRYADVSETVAAQVKPREIVGEPAGPAVVAGYTVLYAGAEPVR